MKYMVIQANNIDKLVTEVNALIEKKWKPQGGVAIVDDPKSAFAIYSQALVKK